MYADALVCFIRNYAMDYVTKFGISLDLFKLELTACIVSVPVEYIWYRHIYLPCDKEVQHQIYNRADSSFASSQWETALLCNDVSHWLGANLESALYNMLGGACMRHRIGSALVEVMAWRLFGLEPLCEPMPNFCQFDSCEQNWVQFEWK